MAAPAQVFDLTPGALADLCATLDLPRYTADQVLDWVYRKGASTLEQMSNVSKTGRARLADALVIYRSERVAEQQASDGTCKSLLRWDGGGETECVMIPAEGRRTACVSSQVGCPVGCRFCASGLGGLEGNLSAGQIVEQVHRLGLGAVARPSAQRMVVCTGAERISHVVFMGMGEPLANYANVTRAIRTLNAPWGAGISARRITISTVGLPAAIRRLLDFDLPVTLALSLHAPNDDLRRQLIPWAEYASIDELLDACDEYFRASGREITLEYILLRHVNDRPEHARELAEVARRLRANVNLIRYNEVRGLPYDRPTTTDVHAFQEILRRAGVNAHIRASRGRDIAAACGQLRHEQRRGTDPVQVTW